MARSLIRCASILMVWIGMSWGCAAVPPCRTADPIQVPAAPATSSKVPTSSTLEHKVKAQEKRINELSLQLNLLKRIDQDQQRQR